MNSRRMFCHILTQVVLLLVIGPVMSYSFIAFMFSFDWEFINDLGGWRHPYITGFSLVIPVPWYAILLAGALAVATLREWSLVKTSWVALALTVVMSFLSFVFLYYFAWSVATSLYE